MEASNKVQLKDIVASQLPEFVRAQYPTFVAFVEAYYEWMGQQEINLEQIRDIDTTLTEFIQYFKAELAHNYPISSSYETERYLLKHIRDQYLAKGSEASYKLLFRLLYSKEVYMDYPGRQMLRVSDGRWQQDVSLFVRVDVGNPYDLVGKIIDIQTSKKLYRTVSVEGYEVTQAVSKLQANIENVITFDAANNIYEIFLNRNFYGDIMPGDVVKYGSEFQGQILPTTSKLRIQNKGFGFKPGMVFQVQSGDGSSLWFKVLTTEKYTNSNGETIDGGLKTIDLIKFGLGYSTDFSINILPTSAVTSSRKIVKTSVNTTYSVQANTISKINILTGGSGYTLPPIVRITASGVTVPAEAHAVIQNGVVTNVVVDFVGLGYDGAGVILENAPGDTTGFGATAEVVLGSIYDYNNLDKTDGFTENGYLSAGDYWDLGARGTGAVLQLVMSGSGGQIVYGGTGYTVGDTFSVHTNIIYEVTEVDGNGAITGITVTDGGSFTTIPTFNETGEFITGISVTGTSARVIPEYKLIDVNILNGGQNYDRNLPVLDIDVPLDVYNNTIITDAKPAKTRLSIADGQVTDVTLLGYVDQIGLLTGGSGYNHNPTIYFSKAENDPSGSGAKGIGYVTNGVVTSVELINGGNSYSQLPVVTSIGTPWKASELVRPNDQVVNDGKIYTVLNESSNYLGVIPPTHTVITTPTGSFIPGFEYTISSLGDTDWNYVAGTTDVTYELGDTFIAEHVGYIGETGEATTNTKLNGPVKLKYVGVAATAEAVSLSYGGYGYVTMPRHTVNGAGGFSDGSYVGTVQRQYFIEAKDTVTNNAALLNVSLGAIARYPGYYKTNDGFLDDSMFIQDSYYYQAFAYVLKIDEQLQSYASVVRSMLHPSGMAMFGEYSINNTVALNVALTSIVKSLGVTLYDPVTILDEWETDEKGNIIAGRYFDIYKSLEDLLGSSFDEVRSYYAVKSVVQTHNAGSFVYTPYKHVYTISELGNTDWNAVAGTTGITYSVGDQLIAVNAGNGNGVATTPDWVDLVEEYLNRVFTKAIGKTGQTESVFMTEPIRTYSFTKSLAHSTPITDIYTYKQTSKVFQDFQPTSEQHAIDFTLNTIDDPLSNATPGGLDVFEEIGYLTLNPYDEGSYQAEWYANERPSNF